MGIVLIIQGYSCFLDLEGILSLFKILKFEQISVLSKWKVVFKYKFKSFL